MRYLLKNLAKLLLLFFSLTSAQAIEIAANHPYLATSQIQLNTKFDLQLPPTIQNTLNAEIPLNFRIKIQLTHREQLFIFNYQAIQKEIILRRQIRYSVFEDSYFLEENAKITSHFSLAQALEQLTRLEDYPLAELAEIHTGLNYQIKAKISLDIWSLPAPLFTQALLTKDWHLSSPWIKEPLRISNE